jgi:hypothetical protein
MRLYPNTRARLLPLRTVEWGALHIALALLILPSCNKQESASPLLGSWSVYLTADSAGASFPHERDGVIVFDEAIPCYCSPDDPEEARQVNGRAYLSYRTIAGRNEPRHGESFRTGSDADQAEEARAMPNQRGVMFYVPAAAGLRFTGRTVGDSISGTWDFANHGEHPRRGQFVMVRTREPAFIDSARVRSLRGVRQWRQDAGSAPTTETDTLSAADTVGPAGALR